MYKLIEALQILSHVICIMETHIKNQMFTSQITFHVNTTTNAGRVAMYRVIHRSVDKLKLNYPTYYKGKRNKFLIDRMEI